MLSILLFHRLLLQLQIAVYSFRRVHESGAGSDIRAARERIRFEPGATVVFDKAYIDYAWLNDLNQGGVWFVTRMKSNCHYPILECREHDRTRGLRADQVSRLKSQRGGDYQGDLRRVSYRDPDTGKWLVFLTNRFDLSAATICDLYKSRLG